MGNYNNRNQNEKPRYFRTTWMRPLNGYAMIKTQQTKIIMLDHLQQLFKKPKTEWMLQRKHRPITSLELMIIKHKSTLHRRIYQQQQYRKP